jgi:hypothetical protein
VRRSLERLANALATKNSEIEMRMSQKEQEGEPVRVEFREGTVWASWSK